MGWSWSAGVNSPESAQVCCDGSTLNWFLMFVLGKRLTRVSWFQALFAQQVSKDLVTWYGQSQRDLKRISNMKADVSRRVWNYLLGSMVSCVSVMHYDMTTANCSMCRVVMMASHVIHWLDEALNKTSTMQTQTMQCYCQSSKWSCQLRRKLTVVYS